MSEININIENSLAAMAYVVADQQTEIKTLREASQKMYADMEELHKKHEETNRLAGEQNKELFDTRAERNELTEKNNKLTTCILDLTQQVNEAKTKILKWIPFPEKGLTFPNVPGQNRPVILIKAEQKTEGMVFEGGQEIPVGHIDIVFAPMNLIDNAFRVTNDDYYRNFLAYCIVNEDNFDVD